MTTHEERLAELLAQVDGGPSAHPTARAYECSAAILASDIIREIEKAAEQRGLRQGWDEGFLDGKRQDAEGEDGPRFVNPYRGEG